jgi:hypothetical protein
MVTQDNKTPPGRVTDAQEGKGSSVEDRKARLSDLLSEIRNLPANDGFKDSARLWKLRTEYDTLLLEQVNEFLTLTERKTDSVLTVENTCDAIEERFMKALARNDLTMKEFLFLTKMNSKRIDRWRKSLLAQKQAIEQRLHRRGGPSAGR